MTKSLGEALAKVREFRRRRGGALRTRSTIFAEVATKGVDKLPPDPRG